MEQKSLDLNTLSRTNNELKRAIRHFIEVAPKTGPLAVQIDNINKALKSNEAMFTFASLVEQYAKTKANIDNIEYQNTKKDLKTLKATITQCAKKNLSSHQADKVLAVVAQINAKQSENSIMLSLAMALDFFAEDISNMRESSKVIVADKDADNNETGVVAHDIHLASKRLLKKLFL